MLGRKILQRVISIENIINCKGCTVQCYTYYLIAMHAYDHEPKHGHGLGDDKVHVPVHVRVYAYVDLHVRVFRRSVTFDVH
jgi:hypothetical protein